MATATQPLARERLEPPQIGVGSSNRRRAPEFWVGVLVPLAPYAPDSVCRGAGRRSDRDGIVEPTQGSVIPREETLDVDVRVECYSGYRGEEEPRRFRLGSLVVEVREIRERWVEPDHRHFEVLGDDGQCYVLRHHRRSRQWELALRGE